MDDIMRDSAADAGGQPVTARHQTSLGALSESDSRPSGREDVGREDLGSEDAGCDGAALQSGYPKSSPLDRREIEALLRSRGVADMSALDPSASDASSPAEPSEPEASEPEAKEPVPAEPAREPEPTEPEPTESISAADAVAALEAAEDTLEIDEGNAMDGEDGLPPVPELADQDAVSRVVFVLLLSQREGLSLFRLAQACNTTQKIVEQSLPLLQQWLDQLALPVEIVRTGDSIKFLSRPDAFPFLQRLRGVKKMEKLSPAALETLAVIAYRQPVMRAEIEAIRGVKAGPMLRTLLQHKLVRVTGRADVPGRPLQYGTTDQFLERFGLASLQELPSVKEWKQLG